MNSWQQLPADAGQIIDTHYKVDWVSGKLWRRSRDRNDGTVDLCWGLIKSGVYEPWNGLIPRVRSWVSATTEEMLDE